MKPPPPLLYLIVAVTATMLSSLMMQDPRWIGPLSAGAMVGVAVTFFTLWKESK